MEEHETVILWSSDLGQSRRVNVPGNRNIVRTHMIYMESVDLYIYHVIMLNFTTPLRRGCGPWCWFLPAEQRPWWGEHVDIRFVLVRTRPILFIMATERVLMGATHSDSVWESFAVEAKPILRTVVWGPWYMTIIFMNQPCFVPKYNKLFQIRCP